MYSILKRVDQYIRDFGIPFSSVRVSSQYFPEYFNRIVLKKLNSKLPYGSNNSYIKDYIFTICGNGKLKLLAISNNDKTTVVINQDDSEIDYEIAGYKLYEGDIIQEAKELEKKFI